VQVPYLQTTGSDLVLNTKNCVLTPVFVQSTYELDITRENIGEKLEKEIEPMAA